MAEARESSSEQGPRRVIAGRYEVGALRRGEDAAALREGVDLLVGRRVLLEMLLGGQPRTIELDHPAWRAPKLSGVFDDTAVVVHDWVPAKLVLPPDDQQASEQIEQLLAVLAALAAAGKVHGGIVSESVVPDGAGQLSSLGSTLAGSNLLTSPGGDAIALAGVLAESLTGSPPLPSVAPSTALLAAARRTRPGLVPALMPLVALVRTPTVRRSSARKRRAMAAGVAFVLAGGGTAAALVARSISEPTTRSGASAASESVIEPVSTTLPSSAASDQASGPTVRSAVEPPPVEPPIDVVPPVDVPSSTPPPSFTATPAKRTDPSKDIVVLPPTPPAVEPLPAELPPVIPPIEPPVAGPPSVDPPVVKPPVGRHPIEDDDEDDDDDHDHDARDDPEGEDGDEGRADDDRDHDAPDHDDRDHDDDHEGNGENTPAPEP